MASAQDLKAASFFETLLMSMSFGAVWIVILLFTGVKQGIAIRRSLLDKKDKVDESYANSADDTFETDIDFMMNVISGGLNKRKQTGQTTIPVLSSQLGRQVSRKTTDINESKDSIDAVAQWKKLAGLK
jgi:hypothetical protein